MKCEDEMRNIMDRILQKLKNIYIGWDYDKYWTCREALKGIVIAAGAIIGRNCFLEHQVTIGRSRGGAPVVGDNVYIGPGAKIFGGIHIGNNVRIGANCVVFEDIPDNATVVLPKPRVIIKDEGYQYYVASPTDDGNSR